MKDEKAIKDTTSEGSVEEPSKNKTGMKLNSKSFTPKFSQNPGSTKSIDEFEISGGTPKNNDNKKDQSQKSKLKLTSKSKAFDPKTRSSNKQLSNPSLTQTVNPTTKPYTPSSLSKTLNTSTSFQPQGKSFLKVSYNHI